MGEGGTSLGSERAHVSLSLDGGRRWGSSLLRRSLRLWDHGVLVPPSTSVTI